MLGTGKWQIKNSASLWKLLLLDKRSANHLSPCSEMNRTAEVLSSLLNTKDAIFISYAQVSIDLHKNIAALRSPLQKQILTSDLQSVG